MAQMFSNQWGGIIYTFCMYFYYLTIERAVLSHVRKQELIKKYIDRSHSIKTKNIEMAKATQKPGS